MTPLKPGDKVAAQFGSQNSWTLGTVLSHEFGQGPLIRVRFQGLDARYYYRKELITEAELALLILQEISNGL